MVDLAKTTAVGKIVKAVQEKKQEKTAKQVCEANGGRWDEEKQVCIFPQREEITPLEVPRVDPKIPEVFREKDGELSGIDIKGKTFLGLSPEEVNQIAQRNLEKTQLPEGTAPVGTAQAAAEQQAIGQQLAGQVGQIQPSVTTPTELDVGESLTVGFREAIPRALTLAGGAAVAGAAAGLVTTGGAASIPLAIAGAAVTFTGSIAASMLRNMEGQRTDNTNAQQRVLDEGKQAAQGWVTLAASDPSRRQESLFQFNSVLQQIQDAHVQMITDTNADDLKFESAVPNLAEFNSFYALGGEKDVLEADMDRALQGQMNFQEVEYRMLALALQTSASTAQPSQKTGGFLSNLIP